MIAVLQVLDVGNLKFLCSFLNPKQAGVFRPSKSRGGGGISPDMLLTSYIAVFQSNHYFMVSNENLGLQWSIEAIIILLCWILLPWDCSEVTYFCPENLLVLGRKILKIHLLWPTCTICTSNKSWKHTKCKSGVEIVIWLNFWVKNQFSKIFASIFKKNFFLKLKFFENFQIQPPKIFFLIILNTKNDNYN